MEPWPQPALNLRSRMEELVASHRLHGTTYGRRLLNVAATLNTSPTPGANASFCGGKKWWPNVDRADDELGIFAGRVQAAHDALENDWKAAAAAFALAQLPARNRARPTTDQTPEQRARKRRCDTQPERKAHAPRAVEEKLAQLRQARSNESDADEETSEDDYTTEDASDDETDDDDGMSDDAPDERGIKRKRWE